MAFAEPACEWMLPYGNSDAIFTVLTLLVHPTDCFKTSSLIYYGYSTDCSQFLIKR